MAVVGLRLGYGFLDRTELEVSYGRSWLQNSAGDVASHLYQAMIRHAVVSSADWLVHVAAGAGGITYRSGADRVGSLSDPAVSGGLGVSYRLSPAWDLRTDLTFMGQYCNGSNPQDGLACNEGSQLGYTQLSAGIRVRMGSDR